MGKQQLPRTILALDLTPTIKSEAETVYDSIPKRVLWDILWNRGAKVYEEPRAIYDALLHEAEMLER